MAERSTINLQLDSAAAILNGHSDAPAAADTLLRSGLDELLAAVRDLPDEHELHVTLRLPRAEVDGDMTDTIRRALAEQCAERIETYEGMMGEIRENSLSRLVTTLFIVVAAIAVFIILIIALPALDFLMGAVGGMVALGAWAVLRSPINTYWQHWRPYRKEMANCRRIMAATVDVEAT